MSTYKRSQRVGSISMEESQIENAVDRFHPENRTFEQVVELFDAVLDSIFSDNIFNQGRFIALEKFSARIVERSTHIDSTRLTKTLKDRIDSLRSR
jgi:hypothetical protein